VLVDGTVEVIEDLPRHDRLRGDRSAPLTSVLSNGFCRCRCADGH